MSPPPESRPDPVADVAAVEREVVVEVVADRGSPHDLAGHLSNEPRPLDEVAEITSTTLSFESLNVLGERLSALHEAEAETVGEEFGVGRPVCLFIRQPERSQAQIHLVILVDEAPLMASDSDDGSSRPLQIRRSRTRAPGTHATPIPTRFGHLDIGRSVRVRVARSVPDVASAGVAEPASGDLRPVDRSGAA